MNYNEYELIYMIHQKEDSAYTFLMDKYDESIRFIIFRYHLNDRRRINFDEFQQLALIKLEDAIQTFREDGLASFSSYYLEIFRRALIDQYRKVKRGTGMYEKSGISLDMVVNEAGGQYLELFSTTDNEQAVQVIERIHQTKTKLSPIECRIVDLRCLGFSYEQIAEKLQINPKKVGNTLSKIKKNKKNV